jgi:hypothetical protein
MGAHAARQAGQIGTRVVSHVGGLVLAVVMVQHSAYRKASARATLH